MKKVLAHGCGALRAGQDSSVFITGPPMVLPLHQRRQQLVRGVLALNPKLRAAFGAVCC